MRKLAVIFLILVATLVVIAAKTPAADASGGPCKVLLLESEDPSIGPQVEAYLTAEGISNVDTMVSYEQTAPALTQLLEYDAVVAWTDDVPVTAETWADALADYVDAGGGVVIAAFGYSAGYRIEGRIMTLGYSPLISGSAIHEVSSLGDYDTDHPLMADVTAVTAFFRSTTTVAPDAELVASWADGLPMVAHNFDGNVVGITLWPGQVGEYWTGDVPQLFANAINFVDGDCGPVTKSGILGSTGVGENGHGIANAPGLQKEFNPKSKAAENAGKK